MQILSTIYIPWFHLSNFVKQGLTKTSFFFFFSFHLPTSQTRQCARANDFGAWSTDSADATLCWLLCCFGCVLSHFYMQLGKSGSALTVQTGRRDQINILTDNSKVKNKLEMSFIYKPAASLSPIRRHYYSWEMFEDMLVDPRQRTKPRITSSQPQHDHLQRGP